MPRTARAPFDPRLALALAGGRAAGLASRLLGRGGGTALPGLVVERVDPAALHKLGARLGDGALVIGGTNGKTTTARMVATILTHAGRRVVHNRSGSNLVRGVLAALAAQSSASGALHGTVGVIEADEAALPAIVAGLRPRFLLFNNLFRDQLDRYGELDHVARRWRATVAALDAGTTLLVNADDPTLVGIVAESPAPVRYFGLTAEAGSPFLLPGLPHAADAAICPRCGGRLAYHQLYLSHLGDWYCPACGNARPPLDVAARDLHLDGVTALSLTVTTGDAPPAAFDLTVPLPGLYNAYNTLAATAAALAFDVAPPRIAGALHGFSAAFGRLERVQVDGRDLVLALVKNPTGCNEVLRMLAGQAGLAAPTLLVINDLDADGRDVSWLWDVDFELLAPGDAPLHTAGLRGPDMAVRLKYAGVAPTRIVPHPPNDLRGALLDFIASASPGATLYVLPTYTALLDVRRVLAGRGAVRDFWRQ